MLESIFLSYFHFIIMTYSIKLKNADEHNGFFLTITQRKNEFGIFPCYINACDKSLSSFVSCLPLLEKTLLKSAPVLTSPFGFDWIASALSEPNNSKMSRKRSAMMDKSEKKSYHCQHNWWKVKDDGMQVLTLRAHIVLISVWSWRAKAHPGESSTLHNLSFRSN